LRATSRRQIFRHQTALLVTSSTACSGGHIQDIRALPSYLKLYYHHFLTTYESRKRCAHMNPFRICVSPCPKMRFLPSICSDDDPVSFSTRFEVSKIIFDTGFTESNSLELLASCFSSDPFCTFPARFTFPYFPLESCAICT
jgi:hypothetical protein